MRKYVLLAFVLFTVKDVLGQVSKNHIEKYNLAFDSIKSDSSFKAYSKKLKVCRVNVSEEILPLSVIGISFMDYLTKHTSLTYDSVANLPSENWKRESQMLRMSSTSRRKRLNIFFSEIRNGILVAEVRYTNKGEKEYLSKPYFGESLSYLFVFEGDEIILKKSKIMNNN